MHCRGNTLHQVSLQGTSLPPRTKNLHNYRWYTSILCLLISLSVCLLSSCMLPSKERKLRPISNVQLVLRNQHKGWFVKDRSWRAKRSFRLSTTKRDKETERQRQRENDRERQRQRENDRERQRQRQRQRVWCLQASLLGVAFLLDTSGGIIPPLDYREVLTLSANNHTNLLWTSSTHTHKHTNAYTHTHTHTHTSDVPIRHT